MGAEVLAVLVAEDGAQLRGAGADAVGLAGLQRRGLLVGMDTGSAGGSELRTPADQLGWLGEAVLLTGWHVRFLSGFWRGSAPLPLLMCAAALQAVDGESGYCRSMDEPSIPTEIMVPWPLGPLYYELPGADGMNARSWVNYKLTATRWHTGTLGKLIDEAGFQRYIGIEMALDGALASLNGAFDATAAGLIGAAEMYLQKDDQELVLTLPYKFNDELLMERLSELKRQRLDFEVDRIVEDVTAALEIGPDRDHPTGWLQQLRRLRNVPVHQNSAPRHIDVIVGTDTVTGISVAGHGKDPVEYLVDATEKVSALTSPVLDLIDYILPNGIPSLRPLLEDDTP